MKSTLKLLRVLLLAWNKNQIIDRNESQSMMSVTYTRAHKTDTV